MAIEKILLATSRELAASESDGADFTGIFQQLSSMLSAEKMMDLEKFKRFLLLLTFTYAVIGKAMQETDEETLLMNALLKSILIMSPDDIRSLFEADPERDILPQMEEFLQGLFGKLRQLGRLQSQQ